MGFLKRIFRNGMQEEVTPASSSSFEQLSSEELEAHLGVQRYGNFLLSDAVRPSYDLQVVPRQGYRHDVYNDAESRSKIPVLMAAISVERLFEVFMDLIDPLGPVVDVVLETSHGQDRHGHLDLYREHIDMPVLKSILWDFEDMLTHDGCAGIAVLNPGVPLEVQFDEHKLLIAYGQDLKAFEQVLQDRELPCQDDMKFITEAEHVHSTSQKFIEQFEELKFRLGIDGTFG